jgi:septal ring factor EnvC (AmiA/AmiB activator)
VEEGDLIYAGETIARVGDTGSLDGPKLHFEIRHSKVELNPREWLK